MERANKYMLTFDNDAHKPVVTAYSKGFGLIILWPSGVLYTNQTGGVRCLYPLEEGVYVPIDMDDLQVKMLVADIGARWNYTKGTGSLDDETAASLNGLFSMGGLSFLSVSLARLEDSHEAWLYVDIASLYVDIASFDEDRWLADLSPMHGFGDCKGVLTWENSD